jgi:signal transduction histidine kinase
MLSAEDLRDNEDAAPGSFIAVSIADSGTGMREEVAAKAFEPFFTTKVGGKSSGLGLSYVFGFVRQLGGHVKIDSAAGCGTLVTLFLPKD